MLKERLCLTGISPERVLTRFRSQNIAVYDVVKTDVNQLCFFVRRRDVKKVFALYPQAGTGYAYTTRRLPARGAGKILLFLQKSIGIVVGGVCFLFLTNMADKTVLKITVDAPAIYLAQVYDTLEENGVRKYTFYDKGKEESVCAKLLSLDGVSYCSVGKKGSVLTVTIKTNTFSTILPKQEFFAEKSGEIVRLVTLSGTPLVAVGGRVEAGQRLVEDGIYSQEGERAFVPIVAYATIACEYVFEYACADEQTAFATAYLEAGLQNEQAEITACDIEKNQETYTVKMSFLWTQRVGI